MGCDEVFLVVVCSAPARVRYRSVGKHNGIWVHGHHGGDTFYYGRGAGSRPTGVAVASDLMRVAREIRSGSPERVSPFAHERLGEYKPLSILEQSRPYYLRFTVEDRPGVLAALAGILAARRISLEAVLQLPSDEKHNLPFVITVETTPERALREALDESGAGVSERAAASASARNRALGKLEVPWAGVTQW